MTEKNLFLFVPNYDGTGSSDASPLSYVILGSLTASTSVAASVLNGSGDSFPGGDLLKAAGITFDDTTGAAGLYFMDDDASLNDGIDRNHGGAGGTYQRFEANGHKSTQTPATLTGELLNRGGYRDHTDGNRISTTRGDRVDVIHGNYKRVVLGRTTNSTDDILYPGTWEVSGGHIQTSAGVVVSVAWTTDTYTDTGNTSVTTWKVITRWANADMITRASGKSEDYYRGPLRRSVIGTWEHSDNPDYPFELSYFDRNATLDWPHPSSTELGAKVTAAMLASSSPPKKYSLPDTDDETYAGDVVNTTRFKDSRDRTTVGEKITAKSFVHRQEDNTGSSDSRVANVKDHLIAKKINRKETYAFKLEYSHTGASKSVTTGNELAIGVGAAALSLKVGASAELVLLTAELELTLGQSLEFSLGAKLSCTVGGTLAFDYAKKEFSINDTEVNLKKAGAWKKAAQLLLIGEESTVSNVFL